MPTANKKDNNHFYIAKNFVKQNTVRHSFQCSLILLFINATATIAKARDNGSVLKNSNLSAFASNCDNLREAHIFDICSSDVYKRSRPSAIMDSVKLKLAF